MKKIDLEKMLLEPEGVAKLAERANGIREKYGTGGLNSGADAMLRYVQPRDNELRPTREEMLANDKDHIQRNPVGATIGTFLPELSKKTPVESMHWAIGRCKENPTVSNQFLVEDAINRILNNNHSVGDAEKIIAEAIQVLSTKTIKEGSNGGDETDSIWSQLYQHSDFGGRSYFVNHTPGFVYRKVRIGTLNNASLNDSISSLYVDASPSEVAGRVILFQDDRFFGRYTSWSTNSSNPSNRVDTPYVGNFMNDRTSSILIVRQYRNELPPIALGSLGIRDEIKNFIGSVPRISLRGEPVITWDMWPEGGSGHPNEPTKRYIHLKIPVEVDVPHWFDYDAEIRYWVYLYVDATGTLRGYVDYYGAWVESGVKHDRIRDRIMDELPGTIGTVNAQIANALRIAESFGPYSRQYFLPGDGSNSGETNSDVSLVLVRR